MAPRNLTRYGWYAVAAALATMALKFGAWALTGSVGLLSDALESTVNLAAGILMLLALRVSAQPPDDTHQYGHEKAEYLSAAAEGLMIIVAAALIVWTAVDRLLHPRPLEQMTVGLTISTSAAIVNLVVGLWFVRLGRRNHSRALEADGRHLLTDVVTSAGVVVGLGLATLTGWERLDPLVAMTVGVNIVVTGGRVLWGSVSGLMDPTLPPEEQATLDAVLAGYAERGVAFHAVRSRQSGHRRFVSLHVLVPGAWSVSRAHGVVEQLEADIRTALAHLDALTVFTHLEPLEDRRSYRDAHLDREPPPAGPRGLTGPTGPEPAPPSAAPAEAAEHREGPR